MARCKRRQEAQQAAQVAIHGHMQEVLLDDSDLESTLPETTLPKLKWGFSTVMLVFRGVPYLENQLGKRGQPQNFCDV